MMLEAYVALLAVGFTAGVLLLVAGLRGTIAAPAAGGRASGAVARWWRGPAGSAAERRIRQGKLVAGLAVGLALLVLTGIPVAALVGGAAVLALPWLWSAGAAERRAIARAEAVAEWTRRLKDQLATGSGLVAALVNSGETAPAPIADQVQSLARRLRSGTAPALALHRFADEVGDTVAEQVVAALLLPLNDRGEQLTSVLTALAADAAKVVSMRREVDAKRAQPRLTIRFMIVLAAVVTVLLWQLELLAVYRTPAGQLLLVVGTASFGGVLAWVNHLTKPPVAPRFLAREG